jgi:hypothetical protein
MFRYKHYNKSRDSSVDIAMGCGLHGRGSIARSDKIFLFSIASRLLKTEILGHYRNKIPGP